MSDAARLFVFFDLPTGTRQERKAAARFRGFLKDSGFFMMQFSIYVRAARDMESIQRHLARVTACLPPRGHVRALAVTQAQYDAMQILSGPEASPTEQAASEQLILL